MEAFESQSFRPVHLHVPSRLDDDLFFAICQANREYRIERTANGDIEIMPPTGAAVRCLKNPRELNGELLMPGFVLDLNRIWEPGF